MLQFTSSMKAGNVCNVFNPVQISGVGSGEFEPPLLSFPFLQSCTWVFDFAIIKCIQTLRKKN